MIRWTTLAPLLLSAVLVVVMMTTTTVAQETTSSSSTTRPPFDLLTREIMEISLIAAQLSSLAYGNGTDYATGFDATRNISTHAHPDYETIQFYDEEPDQAVLARKGGRCYVAFRGTTVTAADWAQNFNRQSRDIYKDGIETTTNGDDDNKPCQVRAGFAEFVDTTRFPLAVADVKACVADLCDGTDTTTHCLVVTGHSQGGATATVASILMYSLNPTVITFGQPITADPGCAYIPSQRMYRYVNFVATENNETAANVTMLVDVVTIAPAAFSGSVHYGHFIAVGPDPQAVRYYGIDDNFTFGGTLRLGGLMPHDIGTESGNHSYEARMTALYASAQQSSPINALGFSPGTLCSPGPLGDLCSQRCDRVTHRCADALVQDLCVVDSCEASYECESNFCSGASACSAGTGLTTGGCPCSTDDDCASGSCGFRVKTCQYSDGEATRSPASATLRPAASPATTPSGPSNNAVSSAANAGRCSLDVMVVGLSIVWGALCLLL